MYLYGASGHARVIMDIVEASSNVNVNENENCCSAQGGVFCNENGNENDLNDNDNENDNFFNGNENDRSARRDASHLKNVNYDDLRTKAEQIR